MRGVVVIVVVVVVVVVCVSDAQSMFYCTEPSSRMLYSKVLGRRAKVNNWAMIIHADEAREDEGGGASSRDS
jgi:hypothetical protein